MANKTIRQLQEASSIDKNRENYFAVFVNDDNDVNKNYTVKLRDESLINQQYNAFRTKTEDLSPFYDEEDINFKILISNDETNNSITLNNVSNQVVESLDDRIEEESEQIITTWIEQNPDAFPVDINDIYRKGKLIQDESDLNNYINIGRYYNQGNYIYNTPFEDGVPPFKLKVQNMTSNCLRQTITTREGSAIRDYMTKRILVPDSEMLPDHQCSVFQPQFSLRGGYFNRYDLVASDPTSVYISGANEMRDTVESFWNVADIFNAYQINAIEDLTVENFTAYNDFYIKLASLNADDETLPIKPNIINITGNSTLSSIEIVFKIPQLQNQLMTMTITKISSNYDYDSLQYKRYSISIRTPQSIILDSYQINKKVFDYTNSDRQCVLLKFHKTGNIQNSYQIPKLLLGYTVSTFNPNMPNINQESKYYIKKYTWQHPNDINTSYTGFIQLEETDFIVSHRQVFTDWQVISIPIYSE